MGTTEEDFQQARKQKAVIKIITVIPSSLHAFWWSILKIIAETMDRVIYISYIKFSPLGGQDTPDDNN